MEDALEKANLDYQWIAEGLEKRWSNFSTIICFETKDPKRRNQVLAYLSGHLDYEACELYLYAPWHGLVRCFRVDDNRTFEPVDEKVVEHKGSSSAWTPDPKLYNTLRHMDKVIRQERTIFILEGLDAPRDETKSGDLIYALRSWAHDPDILSVGSLIVLIVGAVDHVLDDLTTELVAIKRPPLALSSERARILDDLTHQLRVPLPADTREALALATSGLNLHQLECVLREAYQRHHEFPLEVIKQLKSELIARSQLVEVEEPSYGFPNIGGYDAVKRFIYEYVIRVLCEPAEAQRLGLPLPRGILLFGPPGTGKSLFAKALAYETSLPFVNFRTENLFEPWLGASGQNFRNAIQLAEQMSPAIVFIDEIDRFGKRGSAGPRDSASEETRRVFNQLLEWLGDQQRRSIIVGTTNRPQDLDEAFIREGRFDYKIPFLFPGQEARHQILEIHLGLNGSTKPRPPIGMSDDELERLLSELAAKTEGFTGAELEQLLVRAKRNVFRRRGETMVRTDFIKALECFRMNQDTRERKKAEYLAQASDLTNDLAFLEEAAAEQ